MIKFICAAVTASVITTSNIAGVSNVKHVPNVKQLTKCTENNYGKAEKISNIKVITKTYKEDIKGFQGDLKVPIITNMNNKQIEQQLNNVIQNDIISFLNDLKMQGKEYYEECKRLKVEPKDYFAIVDYDVYKNNSNILSIAVHYSEYTGGAHGMNYEKNYNIDVNTGKVLDLKDLFKEGTNYKDIINKEISKQIAVKNSVKDACKIEGFESIEENQCFSIENNNLVIVFQRGDIAPYCMGSLKFNIPLNQYKDILSFKL